jgi:hypothetical protein
MNVRSPRRLIALPLIGLALLALAACGSSSPSIAHLGGKKPGQSSSSGRSSSSLFGGGSPSGGSPGSGAQSHAAISMAGVSGANAVKFAACIRSHGVPSFPDPNSQGVIHDDWIGCVAAANAAVPKASQACRSLLHLGGAPPSAAKSGEGACAAAQVLAVHALPRRD